MDGWMDAILTDERMDRQIDTIWIYGWMDRHTMDGYIYIYIHTLYGWMDG